MQALPSDGMMMTVRASEEEVLPLLSEGDRVSLAAVNGPASVVLSGDRDAVMTLAAHFEALGRKTSPLRVSHAFHSHHMDAMLEAFGRVARGQTYHPPSIPIVSNLTGEMVPEDALRSPDYWVQHVRRSVRFLEGARTLEARGASTFLELGPHGVLTALAQEASSDATRSSRPSGSCTSAGIMSIGRRSSPRRGVVASRFRRTHFNVNASGSMHPSHEPRTSRPRDSHPPSIRCSGRQCRLRAATVSFSPADCRGPSIRGSWDTASSARSFCRGQPSSSSRSSRPIGSDSIGSTS
jgi:acyl transferase domain-containing protein